jgi:hypothetical protein
MSKPWVAVGRYGSVGLEFVLTILLVGALGHWLDGRYGGGHGWIAAPTFLLGVAVAFRNLVRTANGMQRDIEREEARNPSASRWTVDSTWLHREPKADGTTADPAEKRPDDERDVEGGDPRRGPDA